MHLTGESRIAGKIIELSGLRKDGSEFPLELSLSTWKVRGETFCTAIVRDITERKKTGDALKESERRYRHLIESVTDYIYTVRVEDGRVVATSHGSGCVAITGYKAEELETNPHLWIQMVFEEDRNAVLEQAQNALSGKAVPPLEHRIIHKDGKLRWVKNTVVLHFNEQGLLVSYDGLIKDITEIKKLGEQLRHVQKMEAIGQLAGGIAHDFNNILNAILGFGNLIKDKMKKDDPNMPYLEEIIDAGERATHLTKSLLTFSRRQVPDIKLADVNDIVSSIGKMLSRIIGEDIKLRTTLSEKELMVMADHGQIVQVLMNLATNARDAMPDGGVMTIRTEQIELDGEFIKAHGYGNPGEYALITVTDTGKGMSEAIRERIFEPFYTTKEMGKGTGLGLAIVYGIVKQHNGYINVYSEPGMGTTFKIYLPMVMREAEEKEREVLPAPKGGSEKILVAEDDPAMRRLMKDVLGRFGYTVIIAEDGEDAINKFTEHKEKIALVILDMIMPKKSGREAYESIKGMRPDIKTVFLSGYTDDIILKKSMPDGDVVLLLKPVSPNELLRKVREVLDR
jgi:PAS domain S-box-containing protein